MSATSLTVDTLRRIAIDLSLGRAPVGYGDEERAAYEEMRAEFEEFKRKNPKAYIDVFDDPD